MYPTVPGLGMGNDLAQNRIAPEAIDNLRFVPAKNREAGICKQRIFSELFQGIVDIERLSRLDDKDLLLVAFRYRILAMVCRKGMSKTENGVATNSFPCEPEFIGVSAEYVCFLYPQPET